MRDVGYQTRASELVSAGVPQLGGGMPGRYDRLSGGNRLTLSRSDRYNSPVAPSDCNCLISGYRLAQNAFLEDIYCIRRACLGGLFSLRVCNLLPSLGGKKNRFHDKVSDACDWCCLFSTHLGALL